MAWVKTYRSMPDVGLYPNTFFDAVEIDSHWNWLHTNYDNINRTLELDAQYGSNPQYIGGVPASGASLNELQIRAITQDQNSPDTLFGIYLGEASNHNRLALIIKAYRGAIYTWANYGSTVDVQTLIYKRVYTDATTYTDTQISTCGCRVPLTMVHAHLEFFEYQGTFVAGLSNYFTDGSDIKSLWSLWFPTRAAFNNEFDNLAPEGKDKSPEYGPESEPGGYGPGTGGGSGSGGPGPTFDGTSDPWVDYAMKPGIASLGLVNLYKCDVGSLVNLGAELFPDIQFPTSLTDVGPVLAAVSDSIWNSRLIDYIVSAHIVPVDVTAGALEDIKVGTRTMTGIRAHKITDDIIEFNCGTVHVDEYYTNFIDFSGTKCRLYLPLYGMVEIRPEYWQSADLSVKYYFNVVDGSFIVRVFSEVSRHQVPFKAMIGQYTGCACVHVPMTGASYASMFGGMIANAGALAANMASGNISGVATSAINTAAIMGGGAGTQMSNAYNASAGFYGYPCPYLIIERQVSQFSRLYASENGLPLLEARLIGDCSGLTICDNPIMNFACTEGEAQEIIRALKEGVIV